MQNGRSPDNDGLSKEFYVCFFAELGDLLVNVLNYSFKCGELTTSEKQAIITFTEKKDRDKKLKTNFTTQCRCKNCIQSHGPKN